MFAQSAVEPDKEESAFRDQFWRKVRRVAASIPFAEDLLTAYFVMPIDAIPDVVPLLGFTDDAAMLAAALNLMAAHIRPEHRVAAKNKLHEFSRS
jgi:uncharacterized membrane protein YkvA (DUF1232 family)